MRCRPPGAAPWLVALLLVTTTRAAGAQAAASLDAGYAYVSFTGFQGSGALTFIPTLQLERASLLARGVGSLSRFESGRWSASGSGGMSVFSPPFHGVRLEAAASGNATAYRATRTGQLLAQTRVHVHGDSTGGWLGAGTGASLYGKLWQPNTLLDAGAWARIRAMTMTVSLSSAAYSFRDSTGWLLPREGGGFDTTYVHRRVTGYVTDATGTLRWSTGVFDLDVTAGVRPIARYAGDREWAVLSVAAWVRPAAALVVSVGRQPENPLQNLAGLRYASVSVRLGERMRSRPAVPVEERAVATDFALIDGGSDTRTIYVRAPGARRVELASGFTTWQPRTLSRIGGDLWVLTLEIAPGTHDLSLRIDGGPWLPPPGLPAFDDEFGGRVGRLIIGPPHGG